MTKDTVDCEIRVRYAETDQMGVVYYANYLVWFEVGRSEFCRKRGFSYADLEAAGHKLVVTDVHCRYRGSARYDETVRVRTRLKNLNKRMLTFDYQVLRYGTNEVIAEGESEHLSIGLNGKPKILPEEFRIRLAGP